MAKGRPGAAVREFREALKEESEQTPTYLFTLAALYANIGDEVQALSTLRLARRMAESYGQARLVERIDAEIGLLGA